MICRYWPPNGCGTEAPGTPAIWLRMLYCACVRMVVSFRPSPFQGDEAYWKARSVELQNNRWQRSRRKLAKVGHREIGNGSDCGVRIAAGLKKHLDDAYSGQGARLDVLDVASQREETLEPAGDVRLDLLRRHAGIKRCDHHDGDVHGREHVHRHSRETGYADHGNHQAEHDDDVRIFDCESGHDGYSDLNAPSSVDFGTTNWPGLN